MKIVKNIYEEKYGLEDLMWGQIENARILDDGTLQIFFYVDNRDVIELLEVKGKGEAYHTVKKTEGMVMKSILPGIIRELNKLCGEEKFYTIKKDIIYYGTKDLQVEICSFDEIVSIRVDKDTIIIDTLKFKWKLTINGPII